MPTARHLPGRNPQPTEREIVKAVLTWLQGVGCLAWRSNSGSMAGEHKGKRWYVQFHTMPGLADVSLILPDGRAGFIELKRPGQRATEKQAAFLDLANQHGALAFVAHSVAEVEQALAAEGYVVRSGRLVCENG